jgi:hypothetical protein
MSIISEFIIDNQCPTTDHENSSNTLRYLMKYGEIIAAKISVHYFEKNVYNNKA